MKRFNSRFLFSLALGVLVFILSIFYLDKTPSWNAASRAAMPLSIVLDGDLMIDEYADFTGDKATINNHHYSDKGPLPGFLLTPVLFFLNEIVSLDDLSTAEQLEYGIAAGAISLGALPFALLVVGLFKLKLYRHEWGVPLVLMFSLSCFVFSFSATFFSHALAAYLFFLVFRSLINENWLWCGVFLGMSFMTEYTSLIVVPLIVLHTLLRKDFKAALRLGLGLLPFVLGQAVYNYFLTGSAVDFAYKFQENFEANSSNYGFGIPSLSSLYHIVISPYRGLIFYTPVLLAFIWIAKLKSLRLSSKSGLMIWVTTLLIFLIASSKSWYQGWSFGPRYLNAVPVLLFMAVSFRSNLSKLQKLAVYALGVFGVVHLALNRATVLYPSADYKFPLVDLIIPKIVEGKWSDRYLTAGFGMSPVLALMLWLTILCIGMMALNHWHKQLLKTESV